MNLFRTHGWRLALVTSGILMLIGGPMHPEADAKHPLREELAIMTAHPDWIPAHLFVVLSTALLAVGLVAAYRRKAWPAIHRALGIAALAVSLYVVETIFHLAAAVDSHALHHGGAAPVAFTHVGLSVLLYPVSGLAVAYLASRQLVAWRGPRRFAGLPGVAGGLMHALSVPLVLALPNTELTPMFAGSAVLIAVWSLVTGLAGAPRPAAVPAERQPAAV
ncbi:hypothetical protein [Paractinoplanes rishiriensis]|uniref:Uncharacterized protein n=1 Tax=Paractinoplanes rishiriensis TaxID=1050105 RepID=A0A919K9A6_9ACTN|nr:hypothetical protein [Actinoplanes rishiriensis]GIF01068.1 hypothetical protein Ari01nite_85320 [Actinoplanes rishiriensis]